MSTKLSGVVLGAWVVVAGCGGSSPGGHSTGMGGGGASGGAGGHAAQGGAGAQAAAGGSAAHGGTGGEGQTGGSAGHGAGGSAAGGGTGAVGGSGELNPDGGSDDGAATSSFAVGGTVTGLAGAGLTLADGNGHQLSIGASGAFLFATKLAAGSNVAVTVTHQPTSPTQVCAVNSGTAAGIMADLANVAVVCTTTQFTVGGSVGGLAGSGLVLEDNNGDDYSVTASGSFTFATSVASGMAYTVTVKTQPSVPAQTCQVSGGSGTVGAANVTSVAVNCATDTYTVGGTVSGLVGTGLLLENNAGDDLSLTGNGSFAFATAVLSGSPFQVTVKTQPTGPSQVCSVSLGSGTVASTNVTSVAIVCATNSYAVGGTVSGLAGSGLVLQDNLGDNFAVSANGSFDFATGVADGSAYSVSVLTQPSSPSQTCTVTSGSGTIAAGAVSNVGVSCVTSAFTVGGNVVGLGGAGLTLQNNGGDTVAITGNGGFAFPTAMLSGQMYAVTISAQPTAPTQTCTVSGDSGTVGSAAVNSVTVNCATDQFTVGGTVTNLAGDGLTLSLNAGAATVAVTHNGSFSFSSTLASGSSYAVTVGTEPSGPTQTCTVTSGSGTIGSSNISGVLVDCAINSYQVGGTVSGLAGMGLTLQDSGGDNLTVMANGSFVFPTSVLSGQPYNVTVSAQPTTPWQTCAVSAGSGSVGGGDVNNVAVTCTTNSYQIGGSISGLASSVVLQNGSDSVVLSSNGPFVFTNAVPSGGMYAVTVSTQPTNPTQTCTVSNGAGAVAGSNVGLTVACVTNTYAIGGLVSGLTGTGLTLQDNGGDNLVLNANGTFTFATAVASGAAYAVTIKTQPTSPTQTCNLAGATGTVGAAAVSSVNVNCATNSYSVGGSVSGLTGGGLVIQNNGAGDLPVSGSGTFAFAAPVQSGQMYAITVKTQPTNPWETCVVTGGNGTITNASVSAQITCTANPYNVAVSVTGLGGSGLVLQDNAGDNLPITANGTAMFATPVSSGQTYAVTVFSQPTNPWQTCSVASPAGTIAGAGVTLSVSCVNNKYTVGGTVSGLSGSGLVLQDNAGDNLSVSANGSFTFATSVASGSPYAVTVSTAPSSPAQNCAITSGSGTIAGSSVSNVSIACTNVVICSTAPENGSITLTCPAGQTIAALDFASYGTPNGSCGGFSTSSCDATTSTTDVNADCLGLNGCTVGANNGVFGDPCYGTVKRLYVQARCQ